MPRLRVGMVGAGTIAGRHLRNLASFDDVEVCAVADVMPDRARERAPAGARVYGDAAAMMDGESLDAVYICVPPFAHGRAELTAVERGLPMFVEKPLSAGLEVAEEVGAAVAQAGLLTAVGYHWRHLDTVELAQRLLRNRPVRLLTGYWLDATPPLPWWQRQATSGGQMVEQTTHIFDLARLLAGDITCLNATATRLDRDAYPDCDVADVSSASLHFVSGAIGTITSTCLLQWRHRVALHVIADGLAMEIDESKLTVTTAEGVEEHVARTEPFVREDREFLDAVRDGTRNVRVPYAEALATHRVAVTATEASGRHEIVSLEGECGLHRLPAR